MKSALLDQIVNAVLYEGYILYPYRASSKKNARERFTFGRVYPGVFSAAQRGAEPCEMQTECLLHNLSAAATLQISVRFLQPVLRENENNPGTMPLGTPRDNSIWHEAMEREVAVPAISLKAGHALATTNRFTFPASTATEPLYNEEGKTTGGVTRRWEMLAGTLKIQVRPAGENCLKLSVRVENETMIPHEILENQNLVILRTFASTHIILQVEGGEFISPTDPPDDFKKFTSECKNIGVWPVLVGDEAKRECNTLLCSPIILYDYPKIAPESAGDFCDGTEIDEMLALRVMTMTEEEKGEMRRVDGLARKILERTETLSPDHFAKMHGTMRDIKVMEEFFNPARNLNSAWVGGVEIKPGDKILIRPKNRADAFDLMLAGKVAVVEAVEQDAEDKIHFAVVLEDDPGKDLGLMRQPGHRFFYGADEVEPVKEAIA